MSDIFVSYSRSDRNAINPVLSALERNDLQYWLDQSDILPTMEFNEEILEGLARCSWFLMAMTPRSAASEYVKDELHWALTNRNGRIIPVMLETCDPASFHLRLLRIQYADLTNVNGEGVESFERMLKSVRAAGSEQSLGLDHQPLSGDLELISLVLTFVSRHHQKHLHNLTDAASACQAYSGGHSVRHELRDLCSWGLLERRPDTQIGECAGDNRRFVLEQVVKLTSLGKRLAQHVR